MKTILVIGTEAVLTPSQILFQTKSRDMSRTNRKPAPSTEVVTGAEQVVELTPSTGDGTGAN